VEPVFSFAELAQALQQQTPVLLVDARGGADAREGYLASHLPGAVFVDLESELSLEEKDPKSGGRHPLPPIADFCRLIAELGVEPQTPVMVYDDKKGANAAARFWWMMKAIGHQKITVLDDELSSASQYGIPGQSGWVARKSTSFHYQPKDWLLPIATLQDVEWGIETGRAMVVDVRERFRYRGESEPIDLIAGHIPGAVNLPYTENFSAEGRLLDEDLLRDRLEAHLKGRAPQEVIVHCGSGVTACHFLLAMERAGMSGARLYVGSWSEWSRNEKPVGRES
jgi:thiosulfate/3-mercaptopyruvate sulfurtransferase